MTFTKTIKSLIGAAALTVIASVSSAATATFAELNSTGSVTYIGSGPTSTFTGSATASLYGDTSVARDYALNYNFTANIAGQSRSLVGTYGIGSFSIDSLLPAVASLPSSGSQNLGGLTLSYENMMATSSTTASVDYTLALGTDLTAFLRDELGFGSSKGTFTGTYSLNATLTADVETAAAVPLPAAAPLLVFGVGGLAAFGRKRRKNRAKAA
tara:strand:- start:120 stop:758 length:639 start_codon:yes stop_codon:yes gene_type:complete